MQSFNTGIPYSNSNQKSSDPSWPLCIELENNRHFIMLLEHIQEKTGIDCTVLDSNGNTLFAISDSNACSTFVQHAIRESNKCLWRASGKENPVHLDGFHLSGCKCGLHHAMLPISFVEDLNATIVFGPFHLKNDPIDPIFLQKVGAQCDFGSVGSTRKSSELPNLDREKLTYILEHFASLLNIFLQSNQTDNLNSDKPERGNAELNGGVKEHFIQIFEQNPVPQFICTIEDGLLIDVNQGFLNTFQIDRHDAIGSTLSNIGFLTPDEFIKTVEQFQKNSKRLVDYEQPLRDHSGNIRIGLWCAEPIEIGNQDCMLIAFTDITDRKKAEDALRESETRYRLLANNSNDVIWTMSLDGNFTYISPSVVELAGFTPEEVLQIPLLEYVPPESATYMMEVISSELAIPLEEREPFKKLEVQQYAKDGSAIDIEVTASFILNENGDPIGIQGSTRDIRDRKLAEAEKEKLEDQLRQSQKMEAVGRLAGGVAHDFNNLLTSINGYSEMLLTDLGENNPLFEDVREIRDAATRAAQLTSQLLAFSREQAISPKPLDLNVVISEAKKMLIRIIGEDISLTFTPEENLPSILADRSQLEQILMNLVVNARDAMPHGGSLNITTSTGEYSRANEHSREKEKKLYVDLTIVDTGHGMEETTISNIFEPFFTTKDVGKGTGLGLSTVYGIVHQNGGFIEVDSKLEIGTTFHVHLPVCLGKPEDLESQTSKKQLEGTETLLLVEDEFTVRELTKKILLRFGYKVIVAIDAGDALGICQNEETQIDLLLTDVIMPKVNGKQLAKQLKDLRPELKILYMSGYTKDTIDKHGVLEQEVEFLQKPFTMEELGEKVRSVLDSETVSSDPSPAPSTTN